MSVLVIGGTGIDTVVPVPSRSAFTFAADSVPVGPIREYVAHTGTGVALALRALGVPVTVVDSIGEDDAGTRVREAFARWDVPLRTAAAPGGTRRAVNLMTPGGERCSFYDGRDTPGYHLPAEVYRPVLRTARHAHVSIMDWARHLLPDLHAAGLTISTDLHDWDGHNPHHRDFAYGADLVFLSTVALSGTVEEVTRDIFARGLAQMVIATSGAAGATLAVRGTDTRIAQPATGLPGPMINTNGAGDAFAAGFLSGWLDARPVEVCLRRGAVAGAFACTRDVGHAGFIDEPALREQVARLTN